MKKLVLLFSFFFFTVVMWAQNELAMIHQTITAKSYEMKVFNPVYLDLDNEEEELVNLIPQLLIDETMPHIIAQKLDRVAKAVDKDPRLILRWAIREATIISLELNNITTARTWKMPVLLNTHMASNVSTANDIIKYFMKAKSTTSSLE